MKDMLIVGANGQLGKALQAKYPKAQAVDIDELDITNPKAVKAFDWSGIRTILNAAAYTNVDGAETDEGRVVAWKVNVSAVANLVSLAMKKDLLMLHVSTDYVFDGTTKAHKENESFSPLSAYGSTKAAGDAVLGMLPKHYLLRTSGLIGDGKNFVRTMLELGAKGVNPAVVSDQVGRPTFTPQLVAAIDHLLARRAPYGTYNVSNSGQPVSWADLTRQIFKLAKYKNTVSDITTAAYYKDKPGVAARPLSSSFDLTKIEASGLKLKDWQDDLAAYVKKEMAK